MSVHNHDRLVIRSSHGVLIEHSLAAFQEIAGKRSVVAASYHVSHMRSGFAVSFAVSPFDHRHALVIDPASYIGVGIFGGLGVIGPTAVAVDHVGSIYIAGYGGVNGSWSVPTTPTVINGGGVFIAKLSSNGSQVQYVTVLGGNNWSEPYGIAVDDQGSAYVTGGTSSTDFPTTPGAYDRTPGSYGDNNAFVAKLTPLGDSLAYSTYLKGSATDIAYSIAIDGTGDAYVGGQTSSPDFPITSGAYSPTWDGRQDGFITKLNASGSFIDFSTYLGGSPCGQVNALAVDSHGDVFVAGAVIEYGPAPMSFPTTPGALQATFGSQNFAVGVVEELDPTGMQVYATFLGGTHGSWPDTVAIDATGAAYVGGATSMGFPVTPGADNTTGIMNTPDCTTSCDGFVAKLAPGGSALSFATYVDVAATYPGAVAGLTVAQNGAVAFVGSTGPHRLSVTPDALDSNYNTGYGGEGYVEILSADGSSEDYGSYIGGGAGNSAMTAVAVDPSGAFDIVGAVNPATIPTAADPRKTVTSRNRAHHSAASSAVQDVVARVADPLVTQATPSIPTGVTATVVGGTVTIHWIPPSDNSHTILSYTVAAAPGAAYLTVPGSAISATFSGLSPASQYAFAVMATNAMGTGQASDPSNIVTLALLVTTNGLPPATVGSIYTSQLTAVGGALPLKWKRVSGSLPQGLKLNSSGLISGTPKVKTHPSTYSFSVRVTSKKSKGVPAQTAMKNLSLTVS
jgi:hypothetical protein